MSLMSKVEQGMKEAMVRKDAVRLSVLRFLKSALKYAAIEKKAEALSDAEIVQVLQKQIKQRKESIQQFRDGGRQELADKESAELAVLESFLPAQIGDEELAAFVNAEIAREGAATKKDFGRMMKVLTAALAGRADAKRISDLLGKVLR